MIDNLRINLAIVFSVAALALSVVAFTRSNHENRPPADYRLYNACLSAQNANLTVDTFMRDPNGENINRFCSEVAHIKQ